MTARVKSMALDTGTSSDAADVITRTDKERVQAMIRVILADVSGPLTDDQIVELYQARAGDHPSVPLVTPQRIRTARAGLVRDGHVRDANQMAFSTLGHRATAWTLA